MLKDIVPSKKFCKKCKESGLKSIITTGMCTRTLMAIMPSYYDEEGNHRPAVDPNKTTVEYSCSNGHRWKEELE